MNVTKYLLLSALPVVLAGLVACAGEEPKPAEPAAAPAAAAPTMAAKPSISFAEPADGATVKENVHMVFAAENFTIAPVPEGEVTEVRANTGHYHVAVDAECMAPGQVIPKGVNWIHYGKGDTKADMQLPAGSHKLTLAIGDDKHATIEGLCKTITLNVEK